MDEQSILGVNREMEELMCRHEVEIQKEDFLYSTSEEKSEATRRRILEKLDAMRKGMAKLLFDLNSLRSTGMENLVTREHYGVPLEEVVNIQHLSSHLEEDKVEHYVPVEKGEEKGDVQEVGVEYEFTTMLKEFSATKSGEETTNKISPDLISGLQMDTNDKVVSNDDDGVCHNLEATRWEEELKKSKPPVPPPLDGVPTTQTEEAVVPILEEKSAIPTRKKTVENEFSETLTNPPTKREGKGNLSKPQDELLEELMICNVNEVVVDRVTCVNDNLMKSCDLNGKIVGFDKNLVSDEEFVDTLELSNEVWHSHMHCGLIMGKVIDSIELKTKIGSMAEFDENGVFVENELSEKGQIECCVLVLCDSDGCDVKKEMIIGLKGGALFLRIARFSPTGIGVNMFVKPLYYENIVEVIDDSENLVEKTRVEEVFIATKRYSLNFSDNVNEFLVVCCCGCSTIVCTNEFSGKDVGMTLMFSGTNLELTNGSNRTQWHQTLVPPNLRTLGVKCLGEEFLVIKDPIVTI